MNKPTPTRHGDWHVIDGVLTDLGAAPAPVIASSDMRQGGPGIPVPPIDQPEPASTRKSRVRKPSTEE